MPQEGDTEAGEGSLDQQVPKLYGVDGCKAGWVIAEVGANLNTISFRIVTVLREVILGNADSTLAIDIPIGLPEHGRRACDVAARQRLGSRGCCVFSAPSRATLSATTHKDADQVNREALGRGLSIQAYSIIPKVRELDEIITPALQRRVREVHPEVIFASLNGAPVSSRKKTPEGRADRIAVLNHSGLRVTKEWLIHERNRLGPRRLQLDDLVDALACLLAAFYIRSNRFVVLGTERDARGLTMEIVTCKLSSDLKGQRAFSIAREVNGGVFSGISEP